MHSLSKRLGRVVEKCTVRLVAAGISLDAFVTNGVFLNAQVRGIRMIWSKGRGVRMKTLNRDFIDEGDDILATQFACVFTRRVIRYRFDDSDPKIASERRNGYIATSRTVFFFFGCSTSLPQVDLKMCLAVTGPFD